MVVISQLISRIGSLLKTGTPEQADTLIKIPNTVLEPIPFPHSFPSNGGVVFTDSFSLVGQNTITNTGGGAAVDVCSMVPGVWRLTLAIDSEFNWLNANPLAQDNRIFLRQPGLMDAEVWFSPAKVSRIFMELGPIVYTFKEQTNLRINQNGNGVGQTSTINMVVHAARLL